jgi:hypothetical protein
MNVRNYTIEILVSIMVLLLLFYSSDPIFYNDSLRYLEGSLKDPPLYSNIIAILKSMFVTFNSIIIFQTFFIGFGIIFFTKTISKYLRLNLIIKLIIVLSLFLPVIEFYDHLLTEPLSYAFSLFFVSFGIRLIYNFNIPNLVWNSFFVIVLLLIRNQFIFLYPVILFLYLGIFYIYKSRKKLILLTISFIFIIFIHNSLVYLNKYSKKTSLENKTQDYYGSGAFNFIYVDAIYISTIQDLKLFKNNDLKKILTKIFQHTNENKLSLEHYDGRGHFGSNFQVIINLSDLLLYDLAVQKNTTVVKLKKEISIKLIKKNFKKYIKNLFKKFYDSTWLFIFLPFFIMIASFPNFLKEKSNFSLLVLFLSTFTLANHSIVYLFGRVQPRYFIYTDFILLIFVFVCFYVFLQKKME